VFGIVHTATNIQLAFISFHDFNFTQVIPNISHIISATSSFKTSSIFSLALAFSTHEFSALKLFLLCTKYTLFAISARYKASVTAVFQPPAIITSLVLKNIQSQVAQ
jgi:hypothetical protein